MGADRPWRTWASTNRWQRDRHFRPGRQLPAKFDISSYAGKEVTLEFAFYRGQGVAFDNLGFVNVPEPSTWALLGVGLAALGWRGGRKL
ncbi:MAG TPA: hypothetical protein DCE44_00710 [Verrucomicrobiales bacterium]|nr:hypothetical protein [Verrucomicrobiales bacterium]